MINWGIRYRPAVQELERLKPPCVLEAGSGAEGLALFWEGRVFGADLSFKRPPVHTGLRAASSALPFMMKQFPVVVSLDMVEHIPPDQRHQVVQEIARVTSEVLLLGFPSGAAAAQVYRNLAADFQKPGLFRRSPPEWIASHLALGLPDVEEVCEWLRQAGFQITVTWYEPASFHLRLMRLEMWGPIRFVTYGMMRLAGRWLIHWLPEPRGGEKLRVLIKAQRG